MLRRNNVLLLKEKQKAKYTLISYSKLCLYEEKDIVSNFLHIRLSKQLLHTCFVKLNNKVYH